MNYQEALVWLYGLQRFGIKLGLENIRDLISELHANPGSVLPARRRAGASRAVSGAPPETSGEPRVIHVAGTNGKGSVCAMIDSICRAQHYQTALFTSPHLITFRERIRVNGEMISREAVASGLTKIRELIAEWHPHPTFFEVTTALALKYFSERNVDVVILETGMGGRLDATNAVQSTVAIITQVDFDHEKWLGNSLAKIASEKAGIIKSSAPVISAPQIEEVSRVLRERAAECGSTIEFVIAPLERYSINLLGSHQRMNAAIAISALRTAKIYINESSIARGLSSVDWPARFQRWDKRTIIDGAHNPAAARVLLQTWREVFGEQRATLILAVLSDKDLRGICQALVAIADSVILPKIRSERAAPPNHLAEVLSAITSKRQSGSDLPHSITSSIAEAFELARARSGPILVTGSLHFAGEALAYLRGEPAAFEECAQ